MNLKSNKYQLGFSQLHYDAMYNRDFRERKAQTVKAVLKNYFSHDIRRSISLDIGSSTGIITNALSRDFGYIVGVDIDEPAVMYAAKQFKKRNLSFSIADSMNLAFRSNHFDIVICAHVYEHVPDAVRLIDEIHRVLKPGGVCYFAAGNRLQLIEPHYNLPFLSIMPRKMAHVYIRLSKKGESYFEKHLSYWGLKRLVRRFDCIDYTRKILEEPEKYYADYMVPEGSLKQRVAKNIIKYAPRFSPGYIWLLKKVVSYNTP
jgi:2-polyprenyl-3-methyl-5-hydroxy-6-metoxy-1,4-benzoquinol methylase